jgi:hypothetical protein
MSPTSLSLLGVSAGMVLVLPMTDILDPRFVLEDAFEWEASLDVFNKSRIYIRIASSILEVPA